MRDLIRKRRADSEMTIPQIAHETRDRPREALSRCEAQIWNLVSRSGPDPEIRDALEDALNLGDAQRQPDARLRDLHRQVSAVLAAGVDQVLAEHVLFDAFRVSGLVWEAYQDGFDAGLAEGQALVRGRCTDA